MPAPACLQPAWSTKRCGLPVQRQIFRPFGRTCRSECRQSYRSYKAHQCKASTEAQTDDRPELQIEGLEQNYCDDFVCTSSPAVEQNLRALARDVVRTSTWTADLFADEVRYKVSTKKASCLSGLRLRVLWYTTFNSPFAIQDKFRSTEGIAQYRRQTYLAGAVKEPKVVCVVSACIEVY